MSGALIDLVTSFHLSSAEHCFPPTATFKGVHDAEGHVDVYHANDAERRGVERFVTTRNLLEFLWRKNNQPNPESNLQKREIHTLDERVRILVMDEKDLPTEADRKDERVLILDRENQLYDVNEQKGIKSRGSMKGVIIDGNVVMQVRDQFCSCFSCMHIGPSNSICVQLEEVGTWTNLLLRKTLMRSISAEDMPLVTICKFFSSGGPLPADIDDPKIVVGYVSPNNRDVRYAIVIKLPYKLDSKKSQDRMTVTFKFDKGEYVIELLPLMFVKEEDEFRHFILAKSSPKPKMFIQRLTDIVMPNLPMEIGKDRWNMLNILTVIPDGTDHPPHVYKIPLVTIEAMKQLVEAKDAANKQREK